MNDLSLGETEDGLDETTKLEVQMEMNNKTWAERRNHVLDLIKQNPGLQFREIEPTLEGEKDERTRNNPACRNADDQENDSTLR
jgi:hypothetical protein